jgi:hypothetical protein
MPTPLSPNNIFQTPDFMKGMNYAGFSSEVFASPESDQAIDDLLQINANWMAINIFWYQGSKSSVRIERNPQKTVSDASLVHLIRYAQAKGFKILLKPMVDAMDHTWRGDFEPDSWASWFASYTDFIMHYAQLANKHNIDLFCIGCEYPMKEKVVHAGWEKLIAQVKVMYSGPLTYAANFNGNGSYRKVSFWESLDYVGIDAYFSVARKKAGSVKHMRRRWKRVGRRIGKWLRRKAPNKPVIFTELGVTSVEGGAMKPWVYDHLDKPNWQEQANYYEAFFHAFQKRDWFEGAFWWWWDNPSTGDFINDPNGKHQFSYSPRGKEAQAILAAYYA